MVIYFEKKMERLNSGDEKIIFGTNLSILNIGLMKCGRAKWQEAEATRKYFNIVLIHQDKKFFISEFFKVIQDANLVDPALQDNVLIPNDFFEYIYHIGCASQFTFHHKFRIDTRKTNFEQTTDGILYVSGSQEQRTQRSGDNWLGSTTSCMVTSKKFGRNIKTRCNGSTSNLLERKDLSSIKHDRTQSSFTTHSQLIVSRRLS